MEAYMTKNIEAKFNDHFCADDISFLDRVHEETLAHRSRVTTLELPNSVPPSTTTKTADSSCGDISATITKRYQKNIALNTSADIIKNKSIGILLSRANLGAVIVSQTNLFIEQKVLPFTVPDSQLPKVDIDINPESGLSETDDDPGEEVCPLPIVEETYEDPSEEILSDRDLADLICDLEEFDETACQSDRLEIDIAGSISLEQRAFQYAEELTALHELDDEGLEILQGVFEVSCWPATKDSMDRELGNGAKPSELRLAAETRRIWQEHPEFMERRQYSYPTAQLSWPLALTIVRSFDSYPDPDEIECLLERIHEQWQDNNMCRRKYYSFASYLYFRFGADGQHLDIFPEWTFEEDSMLHTECYDIYEDTEIPQITDFATARQFSLIY